MVFHHFLVQLYILIKFWPEKIIFGFFFVNLSKLITLQRGALPQKRWISKDAWIPFLLWFWMRFGDHRALYHVPIVIPAKRFYCQRPINLVTPYQSLVGQVFNFSTNIALEMHNQGDFKVVCLHKHSPQNNLVTRTKVRSDKFSPFPPI